MVNLRSLQSLGRLVQNKSVQVQTRRNLYPHYLRYMAVAGKNNISSVEKVVIYLGFLVGILGPPTFIMYDVGKKRPDRQ